MYVSMLTSAPVDDHNPSTARILADSAAATERKFLHWLGNEEMHECICGM